MADEPIQEPIMSSDNTALEILKGQVESLTAQLQKLTSERDEYRDALTGVSEERDTLRTQIAEPSDLQARIHELEGSIRERSHYDKFAELAKSGKAKDAALKHLWQVSGYKAETDEIDEKALQGVVSRLRKEADYAFDAETPGTTTAAREAARPTSRTKYGLDMTDAPAPAGGGRSGDRNQGADGTIVTAEMRADPKFMLDRRNRELIADAAINGRFR
jgi:flagellar biosynthesis chaperone FliJ